MTGSSSKTMKSFLIIIILLLLQCEFVTGQDDQRIFEIRDQYNAWQTFLESDEIQPKFYYHSTWGDNFEKEAWTKLEPGDTVTLIEVARVFSSPKLGYLVKVNTNSISGDWIINSENYYDKTGDLIFIFWSMNTFQSEVPVTVEKRLYFDSKGLIKELNTIYKMNTREIIDIGFADRQVNPWNRFDDIDFLR